MQHDPPTYVRIEICIYMLRSILDYVETTVDLFFGLQMPIAIDDSKQRTHYQHEQFGHGVFHGRIAITVAQRLVYKLWEQCPRKQVPCTSR